MDRYAALRTSGLYGIDDVTQVFEPRRASRSATTPLPRPAPTAFDLAATRSDRDRTTDRHAAPPRELTAAPDAATPPPTAPAQAMMKDVQRVMIALGSAGLLVMCLLVAVLLWPKSGALRVVLVDDRGDVVERAEVYVDGVKRCDITPCVARDLPAGTRTIQVLAPGYVAPPTFAGLVASTEERTAIVPLQSVALRAQAAVARAPEPAAAPPPAAPPPAPVEAAPAAAEPAAPAAAPVEKPATRPAVRETTPPRSAAPPATVARVSAPREPAPEAAPAPGKGTALLNINSIPVSKVLVDGRPIGATPKVDLAVSPGTHTVTFIHPERGKKSLTVKVGAGDVRTAAVRFSEG